MFNSLPAPPERRMVRGKQPKREGDNGKGKERPKGLPLKSFRYVLGHWFRELPSPDQCLKEQGIYMRIAFFCIIAERTKPSIHARYAQHSFRFLAERQFKTFMNGTLAKRPVTGPREAFSLLPRVLIFTAVFLAMFIGIPSGNLCEVEWGERFNTEFFFYHRKKMHWLTFHKRIEKSYYFSMGYLKLHFR